MPKKSVAGSVGQWWLLMPPFLCFLHCLRYKEASLLTLAWDSLQSISH